MQKLALENCRLNEAAVNAIAQNSGLQVSICSDFALLIAKKILMYKRLPTLFNEVIEYFNVKAKRRYFTLAAPMVSLDH